jgi:hypothetical protein
MRPTIVIACRVLQELLDEMLPQDMPREYMDILLHNTPQKLAGALQEKIDAIPEPSDIVIGYGLCGNGVVGVRARKHTLIIPRTHDCVAIFLGSHQRYVQRFFANPNTYYLTRGWLEANDEPLTDYTDYVRDYGQEDADYIIDMKYRHYRHLCMVGFSQQELDDCREMSMKVAKFCQERWGMAYEEIFGSKDLLEDLVRMASNPTRHNAEFVIVPEGGEIACEDFHRPGERIPAVSRRSE